MMPGRLPCDRYGCWGRSHNRCLRSSHNMLPEKQIVAVMDYAVLHGALYNISAWALYNISHAELSYPDGAPMFGFAVAYMIYI